LPARSDFGKYEEWDNEAKFNIQFQGLERRTEENPEAEFLTSRRILRDVSATLIPAGSRTSWQEMLRGGKN